MASWQAHVVTWLCKRFVKRPFVKSPTVETIRRVFNARKPPVPRGCTAREDTVGGVPGEWMTADGVAPIGTMLYIHGGAHVAGSPITHRPLTSWFAKQGWRVFAVDYRLAPEHQFPSGLEDCVAAYRGLLDSGIERAQLAIVGDSAGGNLTLATCLSLRNAGQPQPPVIALLSPVTDFTWSGPSIKANSERCAMFSHEILPTGANMYLGDHDPRDPLASPYFADLAGLPPMILQASEDEILLDDSRRIVEHAKQAGIEVEIGTWPVVPHDWQMMHKFIPEGRIALEQMQQFLARHLQPPTGKGSVSPQ